MWVNDKRLHCGFKACLVECNQELSQDMIPNSRGFDNFTHAGSIVLLSNALLFATQPLDQVRHALLDRENRKAEVNGLLFVATVLLLSVLDGIASLAQRISGLPNQTSVYFHSYTFVLSDLVWIQKHQHNISDMTYATKSFYEFANYVKHEQPWIGEPSLHPRTYIRDVYDDENKGYYYDVLVVVYKEVKNMVSRLAKQYSQPVPVFPSL